MPVGEKITLEEAVKMALEKRTEFLEQMMQEFYDRETAGASTPAEAEAAWSRWKAEIFPHVAEAATVKTEEVIAGWVRRYD